MADPIWRGSTDLRNINFNPNAAINTAANAASSLARILQAEEKLAADKAHNAATLQLAQDKFDFEAGAEGRRRALNAERAGDFESILGSALEEERKNFKFDPSTNKALEKEFFSGNRVDDQGVRILSRGDANLSTEDEEEIGPVNTTAIRHGKLFDAHKARIADEIKQTPSLLVKNPSKLQDRLVREMRAKGYDDDKINTLVTGYMDQHFPKRSAELQKELVKLLPKRESLSSFIKAMKGSSGSGSGDSRAKSDKNTMETIKFQNEWIKEQGITQGSRFWLQHGFDVGDEDLFADSVKNFTLRMAERGISPATSIQMLEGLKTDNTVKFSLKNPSKTDLDNLVKLGQTIQGQNSGLLSGLNTIDDARNLLAEENRLFNQNLQNILAGSGRRGATPEMRQRLLLDSDQLSQSGIMPFVAPDPAPTTTGGQQTTATTEPAGSNPAVDPNPVPELSVVQELGFNQNRSDPRQIKQEYVEKRQQILSDPQNTRALRLLDQASQGRHAPGTRPFAERLAHADMMEQQGRKDIADRIRRQTREAIETSKKRAKAIIDANPEWFKKTKAEEEARITRLLSDLNEREQIDLRDMKVRSAAEHELLKQNVFNTPILAP